MEIVLLENKGFSTQKTKLKIVNKDKLLQSYTLVLIDSLNNISKTCCKRM